MNGEYEIPKELISGMEKAIALNTLRDQYVRAPFGFKKAKKLAIEAQALKRTFWDKIYTLYPEMSTENRWQYNSGDTKIRIFKG